MSSILRSQERADVLTHVSGNLKRLRTQIGLSQTGLATASGVSRRMIVAVERGEANISLASLDKLASVLGVDFIELVRHPERLTREIINEVTWRGNHHDSVATLLGSAPASTEAQMWEWRLGPGDRYNAEPDPAGWREMLYVAEGTLTLILSGVPRDYAAGTSAIYISSQEYSYANESSDLVCFTRTVLI